MPTTSPPQPTALVTGAASGIGRATVTLLLARGWRVWAADLRPVSIPELWPGQEEAGSLRSLQTDVASEDSVRDTIRVIAAEDGNRLDALVNSAGVVSVGHFLEWEPAEWERCFRINLLGTYLMIKHAAPLLKASGRGKIVNISSMSGKTPNLFTAPYGASKAGVISLTRSAAQALAPDVTVNCVCPGIIGTAMWEQLDREFRDAGAGIEFHSRAAQAPAGRPGDPMEVSKAIEFLLSDAASFVTGEDLNVSGGMIMF